MLLQSCNYCTSPPLSAQVNGISLIGETHKEVISILKELPVRVYMACCRPAPLLQIDTDSAQSGLEALPTDPSKIGREHV